MARQSGDTVQAWFWIGTPLVASGSPLTYTLVKATHLTAATLLSDHASLTLDDQGEEIDVTAIGDTNRVYLAGKGQVGGTLDFWYNLDDNALQPTLVRGAVGMMIIRPNNAADKYEWVCPATILGRSIGAQVNAGLPYSLTWRAAGNLIVQKIASGTV